MKSKRFEALAARPVNQDGFVSEWPEVGLIAMNSPFDPKPSINVNEDLKAIEEMMARKVTGVDFVKALHRAGYDDVANSVFNMLKQRVAGDYLHTASMMDSNFHVISAVNEPNDYHGPMTGYQLSEARWDEIKNIPNAVRPEDF